MAHKASSAFVVLLIIIAVGVFAYYYFYLPSTSNNLFVSLTDPANVPVGTQMLNISYSSIMVHSVNGSGWLNVPGSGTLNLLSLSNVSVLLGALHVASGTQIDMLRFNVTSSSIEFNNSLYSVSLPSSQITIPVLGRQSVNGTENLLADLTPTVITVFTGKTTLFIMVPSVRAVLVGNKNISARAVGSKESLSQNETDSLDALIANIAVSGVSLSSLNNVSSVSVTVQNNANKSVQIRHVILFGNESVFVKGLGVLPSRNGTSGHAPSSENESESEIEHEGLQSQMMRTVNFLVNSNGSLFLPAEGSEFEGPGYNLGAGQSFTFSFNSNITLGGGNVLVNFVNGTSYKVVVQGENGARASANVTAT